MIVLSICATFTLLVWGLNIYIVTGLNTGQKGIMCWLYKRDERNVITTVQIRAEDTDYDVLVTQF